MTDETSEMRGRLRKRRDVALNLRITFASERTRRRARIRSVRVGLREAMRLYARLDAAIEAIGRELLSAPEGRDVDVSPIVPRDTPASLRAGARRQALVSWRDELVAWVAPGRALEWINPGRAVARGVVEDVHGDAVRVRTETSEIRTLRLSDVWPAHQDDRERIFAAYEAKTRASQAYGRQR